MEKAESIDAPQKALPDLPTDRDSKRRGQHFSSEPSTARESRRETDVEENAGTRANDIKVLQIQNEARRRELAYNHKLLDQMVNFAAEIETIATRLQSTILEMRDKQKDASEWFISSNQF